MNKSDRPRDRALPGLGSYDVIVAGGGAAGCAAALSAARLGAAVLLVEKDGYLGGATVSQLVGAVLSTNGVDFQGIWHEWMRALIRLGGVYEPRYASGVLSYLIAGSVYPEMVKHAWDELTEGTGIKILHHASVADVVLDGASVTGVVVLTKAGLRVAGCKQLIDCTGDGLVAHLAGAEWTQGDGEHEYAMACTTVFRLCGIGRNADPTEREGLPEKWAQFQKTTDDAFQKTGYQPNFGKIFGGATVHPDLVSVAASRVLYANPIDVWDIGRVEREGRRQALYMTRFLKQNVPSRRDAWLVDTAAHIGVRSSRRVVCDAVMMDADALGFVKYADEVARSSWDLDIWPADSYTAPSVPRHEPWYQERIERMREGEYFSVRYGALCCRGFENLLVAGRCVSSTPLAQSSLRIQQTCMATGQAAGVAAALCAGSKQTLRALPIPALREELDRQRAVEPALPLLRGLPCAPGIDAKAGED